MNIEKNLSRILESAPDGITVTNEHGTVLFVSDRIIEMLGLTESGEIIGTKSIDWIHPSDREKARFYISKAATGQATGGAAEYRMLRRDRSSFYLETRGRALLDQAGNFQGMIYISRDISERKNLEADHIFQSRYEILESLVGGVVHDFNNIFTAISGHLSLVKLVPEISGEILHSVDQMESAVKQARQLAEKLLKLHGSNVPEKTRFSMIKMAAEITSLLVKTDRIRCTVIHDENVPDVLADKVQINQVISNLVINASQAMPEGGEIVVRSGTVNGIRHKFLDTSRDYVFLSVTDTGEGISNDNLPRIFDPYFTTKSSGTGLGLFTSYSIMKNHGGRLIASSIPEKGTVFTLYLPQP